MTALPEHIRTPHPDRFPVTSPSYDEVLAAHEEAVVGDADGYLDPVSGSWVFTAAYLEERGHCCDLGCRHCPWIERP